MSKNFVLIFQLGKYTKIYPDIQPFCEKFLISLFVTSAGVEPTFWASKALVLPLDDEVLCERTKQKNPIFLRPGLTLFVVCFKFYILNFG